jgi:type II secretory pathway pseudopilin PulG
MFMNKVRGIANLGLIVVLGILGTAALIGVMNYVSAANYGVQTENQIRALWDQNKNVLGQYTLKVQEAAAVPEMYKNDLAEVMTKTMTAKYGADGSKAVFQWLKDANINFDSTTYIKVQQIIEAGRNEFQVSQTRLIDAKRSYQDNLGYVWRGFWLKLAGYPKLDLEKFKVIVAGDTEQIFESGVQAPIKLR